MSWWFLWVSREMQVPSSQGQPYCDCRSRLTWINNRDIPVFNPLTCFMSSSGSPRTRPETSFPHWRLLRDLSLLLATRLPTALVIALQVVCLGGANERMSTHNGNLSAIHLRKNVVRDPQCILSLGTSEPGPYDFIFLKVCLFMFVRVSDPLRPELQWAAMWVYVGNGTQVLCKSS